MVNYLYYVSGTIMINYCTVSGKVRGHKGKNDNRQCKLCGEECESVVHVLWQCSVYDTIENVLRGGGSEEFSTLNNFKRTGFVFGA